MDQWVINALGKWPNVPAVYGWLSLDRRGRWLLKGEPITQAHIIDLIERNYAVDPQGRWYFQNGPQRVFVALEYTPFIVRAMPDGTLVTHTGSSYGELSAVYVDEHGALVLQGQPGPAVLADHDLDWAVERLEQGGHLATETEVDAAISLASGSTTALSLRTYDRFIPLQRLDAEAIPCRLRFVRDPHLTEI